MLGSSTLARQDSQPLARPLVHPQNVSMKRAALVSKEFRPVIFASGGFSADFNQNSSLATCSPDFLYLPTSGEHCTGDAIEMCTPQAW